MEVGLERIGRESGTTTTRAAETVFAESRAGIAEEERKKMRERERERERENEEERKS